MNNKITFPVLNVKLVPREKIVANSYNPNHVAKDKLDLLKQSIIDNGFCFPIMVIYDKDRDLYVIVDGFHRFLLCSEDHLDISMVPVVELEHDISQRMIATIQFNKAKGVHAVDLDADIVLSLVEQGMTDEDISIHLGIDLDTVYRYRQVAGIADVFGSVDFSPSWEMVENK